MKSDGLHRAPVFCERDACKETGKVGDALKGYEPKLNHPLSFFCTSVIPNLTEICSECSEPRQACDDRQLKLSPS
jgi:hypothetical protein